MEDVKRLKIKFVLLLYSLYTYLNDLIEKQGSIMFLVFEFSMFLFDITKLDKDFFQCVNVIKKLDLIM